MSVDLTDLIPSLKRQVSAPGEEETTFPDANDASWLGYLQDAFWECRLDGMLAGFDEANGFVDPTSGTTDITRDLQALVILYAGIDIIVNQLRGINTLFRAQAGPVSFETQHSAQVLKGILDELKSRRDLVLIRLSDVGAVPSFYIDAVIGRDISIGYGLTNWVGY